MSLRTQADPFAGHSLPLIVAVADAEMLLEAFAGVLELYCIFAVTTAGNMDRLLAQVV